MSIPEQYVVNCVVQHQTRHRHRNLCFVVVVVVVVVVLVIIVVIVKSFRGVVVNSTLSFRKMIFYDPIMVGSIRFH
jgi:hypothetical protein